MSRALQLVQQRRCSWRSRCGCPCRQVVYKATLNGASEVPASDSKGTGKARLVYDATARS